MKGGPEFAKELIGCFGEDRFYHCCMRTEPGVILAVKVRSMIGPISDEPRECSEFFRSIGIKADESLVSKVFRHPTELDWSDMCMVAFNFSKFWKEFGLRTNKLPASLHARMLLGEKNEWTEKYVKIMEENDEVRKLPDRGDGSDVDSPEPKA